MNQHAHIRYSDGMPREDQRHIQMRMREPLAATVDAYAAAHGGITFTAAMTVLIARALRAEGYLPGGPYDLTANDTAALAQD